LRTMRASYSTRPTRALIFLTSCRIQNAFSATNARSHSG
jgi:hypothetical protein